MRDRAYRRHQRTRMEAHARKVIGANWGVDDPNILEFHVVQSADNLQVCSCPACRTPRNNDWAPNDERLTMAERRMNESFREQMEAVNEAEF